MSVTIGQSTDQRRSFGFFCCSYCFNAQLILPDFFSPSFFFDFLRFFMGEPSQPSQATSVQAQCVGVGQQLQTVCRLSWETERGRRRGWSQEDSRQLLYAQILFFQLFTATVALSCLSPLRPDVLHDQIPKWKLLHRSHSPEVFFFSSVLLQIMSFHCCRFSFFPPVFFVCGNNCIVCFCLSISLFCILHPDLFLVVPLCPIHTPSCRLLFNQSCQQVSLWTDIRQFVDCMATMPWQIHCPATPCVSTAAHTPSAALPQGIEGSSDSSAS